MNMMIPGDLFSYKIQIADYHTLTLLRIFWILEKKIYNPFIPHPDLKENVMFWWSKALW